MALLPVPAQTDQFQNFPADCQMHCDGPVCPWRPIMVAPPVRYPSHALTRSILHMFPRRGDLREFSVVMALASHTTPSIFRWRYFHHLVVLYHLIRLIA